MNRETTRQLLVVRLRAEEGIEIPRGVLSR